MARASIESDGDTRWICSPTDVRGPRTVEERAIVDIADAMEAQRVVTSWSAYAPSPVVAWPRAARDWGLAGLWIKDEGRRFAVGSFKSLGPPYAMTVRLASRISKRLAESIDATAIGSGRFTSPLADETVCAATSGNHGRALAWAAREWGAQSVIFMPEGTSAFREQAIRSYGARTVRVSGDYDAAHAFAEQEAARSGWSLIADSPDGPDPDCGRRIMHGYTIVGSELVDVFRNTEPPTHIFVCAGSGLLVAAVAARWSMEPGTPMPRVIPVVPLSCDGYLLSLANGRRSPSVGSTDTVMDGLSVRWPSAAAWSILARRAFAAVAVSDSAAVTALTWLDRPIETDPKVIAGETGVAAMAGLLSVLASASARQAMELNNESRVVVVVTEGATDPATRARLLPQ